MTLDKILDICFVLISAYALYFHYRRRRADAARQTLKKISKLFFNKDWIVPVPSMLSKDDPIKMLGEVIRHDRTGICNAFKKEDPDLIKLTELIDEDERSLSPMHYKLNSEAWRLTDNYLILGIKGGDSEKLDGLISDMRINSHLTGAFLIFPKRTPFADELYDMLREAEGVVDITALLPIQRCSIVQKIIQYSVK